MFESMPDPDALNELLRRLPPEEADEVLASIYDCSGAPEEESADALAAWLRGRCPEP